MDDVQFYFDQLSASNDVVKVADGSNIGIAGRYMFRVDGTEVLMPGCLPYSGHRTMCDYGILCLGSAAEVLKNKR